MEEMAGNIVRHGFSMDNKDHSVDIRVVRKNENVILRIRDNCGVFDPSAYHDSMKPGNNFDNTGIVLVYGIAKKVEYQNLLGMNLNSMDRLIPVLGKHLGYGAFEAPEIPHKVIVMIIDIPHVPVFCSIFQKLSPFPQAVCTDGPGRALQ